jgi:adenylosuccinate lyase
MAAVKAGAGRETAHEALKELSTKALIARREGKPSSLIDSIAADPRIPLDKTALEIIISNPKEFIGDASSQTERVIVRVMAAIKEFPGAGSYRPGLIR